MSWKEPWWCWDETRDFACSVCGGESPDWFWDEEGGLREDTNLSTGSAVRADARNVAMSIGGGADPDSSPAFSLLRCNFA
jgi:hypothetical protein